MKAKKGQVLVRATERHIKEGDPQSCYDCPIALALEEATGQTWNVGSTDAVMDLLTAGRKPVIKLPHEAVMFIGKFDHLDRADWMSKPGPFEFTIPARYADRERWMT